MLVTKWRDKSGCGNDAYASGDARPELIEEGLNDLPSIYFETANKQFGIPGLGLSSYTIFILMKSPLPNVNRVFFRNDNFSIGWRANGKEFSFAHEPANNQKPFKIDKYNYDSINLMVIGREGSNQGWFRINGEDVDTTGSSIRWSKANPYIGNLPQGYISEILVYNRVLDSEERDSIEEYLMVKYGLVT